MEFIESADKEMLLKTATIRGDFVFASGKRAKEKFDFDRIVTNEQLYNVAIHGLLKCIRSKVPVEEYNTILTVGNGATAIGDYLADELMSWHVPARKNENGFYITQKSEPEANALLVDDVYTTGSSMEKVKAIYPGKIVAGFVVLDRSGKERPVLSDNVPVFSAMRHTY